MSGSNLGRLFLYRESSLQSPVENFVTEALAIALNQDPTPLLRALATLKNATPRQFDRLARIQSLIKKVDLHAQACTQKPLSAADDRRARLDLVLNLNHEDEKAEVWFENKVDSGPSGADQLAHYLKQADAAPDQPLVLTLSRLGDPFHEDVPAISWSSLMRNVEDDSGWWWHELSALLEERRVIYSAPAPDAEEQHLMLMEKVNEKIQALWPGQNLHWRQPKRMKVFAKHSTRYMSGGWEVSGGPVRYGLMSNSPTGLEWRVTLGDGSNADESVNPNPSDILRAAERNALPDTWERDTGSQTAVLLKRRPRCEPEDLLELEKWMLQAFDELATARVLEPYLTALETKRQRTAPV